MRISARGQVTIPIALRERAGLMPHTEVAFHFDGTAVRILLATPRKRMGHGERLVAHMRGRGDGKLTTDEIMSLTREK